MASRAWSETDVQVLELHVHDEDWRNALSNRFPDRTLDAIKTRLSKLRSELGIKGRRGAREEDQDRSNAKAVVATQKLLEAIDRAGLRP